MIGGRDHEKNLQLSFRIRSEIRRRFSPAMRREAVSAATLDKLWARRTTSSGKNITVHRLKSETRPAERHRYGTVTGRSFS